MKKNQLAPQIFLISYWILVIARLLTFLTVVRWPVSTWLVMYLLDFVDYTAALRAGLTFTTYEWVDKTVDVITRFYLAWAGFILGGPYWILLAMVLFRLVGDVGLALTRNRTYLVMFPNLIEYFFPLYVIYLYSYQGNTLILISFIVISTIVKVIHEYVMHVTDWIDPVNLAYLKRHRRQHDRQLNSTRV